jgi:PQQ-dependent catabolism-associated CXXCW motif protein
MVLRSFALGAGLVLAACTAPAPPPTVAAIVYDNETADYGVAPTNAIRTTDFDAPTPTIVDGAQTITTLQLKDMLASATPPLLIDVLGNVDTSLPTAVSVPDAGLGSSLNDPLQARFGAVMFRLTGGDRSRPVAVFCLSRICWLSHNAAVRLVAMGYTQVYWYRGGRNAWREAGLPMAPVRMASP